MIRRRVQLTERSAREIQLPSEDVDFLLTHARNLLDVTPTFHRRYYRITSRAFVGWFDTPNFRFAIRPKVPWPTLRMLLGLNNDITSVETITQPDRVLLNALARELAERIRTVSLIGVVGGYREQDTSTTYLRGKLRATAQLRDAAARAFPDRFHITDSTFDLDTPWNWIPRTIATDLLERSNLPDSTHQKLREAIQLLGDVPHRVLSDRNFHEAEAEPRAAHYRPLLALCRQLHEGFAIAHLGGMKSGAFLIDLSRTFENYLTTELREVLAKQPDWSVENQKPYGVGPVVLQPDIVIQKQTKTRAALDAKWKIPGQTPDAADLHQIIAYATVSGTDHVGLVYPGGRFARRVFQIPGTPIRVSLFRIQVVGTTNECKSSIVNLSRVIRRRSH